MSRAPADRPAPVLLVTREGMGHADAPLALKLLRTYLTLLIDDGALPEAICFYTEGVKLVVEGSALLDVLRDLQGRGVSLIACRTCLDYFGLADRVRVGIIGGMGDIVAAQMKAAKVITL